MLTNYNRIYGGMFRGSLYGVGALKIAVWAYVLAEMKPSKADGEFYVELNTKQLSDCLGEEEADVHNTIEFLEAPDPNSRTSEDDGRRLRKVGQFLYRVVNGKEYQQFEFAEKRRQQWRESKARSRKPKPVRRDGEQEPAWMSQAKEEEWQRKLKEAEALSAEETAAPQTAGDGQPAPPASSSPTTA